MRSATPSENGGHPNGDEYLRSPLAKRKKLAAERSGYSKLKEGMTADELSSTLEETVNNGPGPSSPHPPAIPETSEEAVNGEDGEGDDEEEEYEEEDEDDFLARDMEEEEWG